MRLNVTLIGIRPLLMHNGRMANPLDPHQQALAALTSKRNKTLEDHGQIMHMEARGSFWETEDGKMGIPTAAVWSCLYVAGKAFRLGEDIKRGLSYDDDVKPVIVDGRDWSPDDWLARGSSGVDVRMVVVNKRKTLRSRPRIPAGWQSNHEFLLREDVMNTEAIIPVLQRAGDLVGIGDWRPLYGRFEVSLAD